MRVVGSVGFSSALRAGLFAALLLLSISALTAIGGLAGCYSPSPAPGLPCTEDLQCPDGQVCSPTAICVASGSVHAILDDDVNDFDEPGAIFDGAILSPRGTLESAPWMTHAMHVSALGDAAFSDAQAVTWESLADARVADEGYFYSANIGWGDGSTPPALGNKGIDVTILVEAELYLEAGTWKLELRCDDTGFAELAEPGSSKYTRILVSSGTLTTTNYEAKVTGWHRVRGAFVNRNGAGAYNLRGVAGNGATNTFDSARMRAAVPATANGLVVDAFDSPSLLHYRATSISGTLDNLVYGDGVPPGTGISTAGAYSLRWSGQFFVEEKLNGFTLSTENAAHRVWIDGELKADKMTLPAGTSSTITGLNLATGWHDVVIDLDKRITGSVAMRISEIDGDEDVFDVSNLRPVVSPALRWMSSRNGTVTAIPEAPAAALARTLFFPNIPGTVTAASIEIAFNHPVHAELMLSARWGAINRTVSPAGSLTGTGFSRQRYAITPRDYNLTPSGSWVLSILDTIATTPPPDPLPELSEVSATMSYIDTSAAAAPYPQAATYISSPRDLGDDVVAFGKSTWKLVHDRGGTVEISLRTAATPEECATAEWHPVDADGHTNAVPSRYVQYRIILRTTGFYPATLDSYTLEYYSAD